jgi:hypothetical protein
MSNDLTPAQAGSLAHFASYGYPPESRQNEPKARATKDSWTTKPFKAPVSSSWDLPIPPADLSKLLYGSIPQEMENKWFVYAEGPNEEGDVEVHFVRSWTGYRIATLEANMKGRVTGLVWETSEEAVNKPTLPGTKEIVREVCRHIMGVELAPEPET